MMKLPILMAVAATAAIGAVQTSAQLNMPDAAGYMARGIAMYNDRNFDGCLDQLLQLRQLNPSEAQSEDALFYMAMSTLYSGDDEALGLLETFVEMYGGSTRVAEVKAAIGDYHFTRGAYGAALTAYAKVDQRMLSGNLLEDLEYRTAYCMMMLGENDAAVQRMEAIVRRGGSYANAARFYIGYIKYSEGAYSAALEAWKDVDTSTEPGSATGYYRSQIYFMRGEYAEAAKLAQQVLASGRVGQFRAEANRIAGESLFNLGKRNDAIPFLWQYAAEATDPQPSAYYMLGVSEYEAGRYNAAVPLLQKAVNEPDALGQSACLYLGQSYVKRGDTDAALLMFERAYNMDCVSNVTETAFYNYIVALMSGGRSPFSRTVTMLEEFLTRFPHSQYTPTVRDLALEGYLSNQDYDSVVRLTATDAAQSSSAARVARQQALYMLGTRAYGAGQYAGALSLFDEGATLRGGDSSVARICRLRAAACQYDLGEYGKSLSGYQSYIRSGGDDDSNMAIACYGAGYAAYMLEDYNGALGWFRKAFDIAPASDARLKADAMNRAGDCEYMQSHFTQAQTYYAKAYATDPSAGDYAMYQQALMKGYSRDHRGKIAMLDEVIASYPNSALVPAAMLEQAETYVALDENTNAIAAYKKLVRAYPQTSYGRNGYLQLAITQMSAGERDNAIETYKKVIYTYPTSEEAKVALEDLFKVCAEAGRLGELTEFVNSVPNAPQINASDIEAAAFMAAESSYMDHADVSRLKEFVAEYPRGVYEPQALYYLAENAAEHKRWPEALEYASRLTLSYPDSEVAEDAMLIKGQSEAALGKTEIAYNTYSTLESRTGGARTQLEARLGMMRTAVALDRWAELADVTDRLLATSSAGGAMVDEVEFNRALALDRLGNYADADRLWRSIAASPQSEYGAKSAVYLGESLMKRGKLNEARSVVNTLIDAEPDNQYWLARAFILLSDILRQQGQKFEADEYLRTLKSNYPGQEADIFEMIDIRLNND